MLDKRLEKELALGTAKEGVQSLDKEISRLKSRQKSLVSNDAYVGNLSQQIEIVRKEYFDLVNKLQDAEQVSKKPDSRLSVMEPAQMPDKPEATHKAVVSAFSGASTGILGILFLFLVAFFDRSVSSPYKLEQATQLSVLGSLNQLKLKKSDLNQVFSGNLNSNETSSFIESLRKIRFLVESSGGKTFLVSSLNPGEGKSFFMLALAYAFSLTHKRVLLIDTNFRNNSLSNLATIAADQVPFESGISNSANNSNKNPLPVSPGFLPATVDVLPNFGGNLSPTEAMAGKDFIRILYQYQQQYDYIFLEGPALNHYADTRELAQMADKVIGVFSAKSSVESKDAEALAYLKHLENKYLGSVLNMVKNQDQV
ncbi:MAG: hypothetical protein R2784_08880 [Saprospiraceae bacterium]